MLRSHCTLYTVTTNSFCWDHTVHHAELKLTLWKCFLIKSSYLEQIELRYTFQIVAVNVLLTTFTELAFKNFGKRSHDYFSVFR